MKKNIVIVHYNTPLLTSCLVRSINRFVDDAVIYIFDNSDKYPFTAEFDNVTIIDNTKGQIINFEKWLEGYPERVNTSASKNGYGSAKHAYSVQKCIDLIDENFILLDSDILLKRDISHIINNECVFVGGTEFWKTNTAKYPRERAIPYVCFINVKKCKEKNIRYFDDKRIYGLSQNGDNYDTGASFLEEIEKNKLEWKKIEPSNFIVHYKAGSWVEDARTHDSYKQLTFDVWLNKNKRYWAKTKHNKVVYTCITGDYDSLLEPTYLCDDFDYICFTDNQNMTSDVWEIRSLPKETDGLSQVKKQRYVKINPHKCLSEYDLSIWVDGNIELNGDLNKFLDNTLKDDCAIYIPKHPQRDCIYNEAEAVLSMKKDTIGNVIPQIDEYEKEGFPRNYGLVQSNIIVRKHNDKNCIKLMECWFDELKNKSHRDQLSFNYVCWKNQDVNFEYLDKDICKSKWFYWHGKHTKYNTNKVKSKTIHNTRKIKMEDIGFF